MTLGERVRLACRWEVQARKLGNVHPGAAFADTTADDFLKSAEAIAPLWDRSDSTIAQLILDAVRATQSAVGKNTNLGIILLLAPLRSRETAKAMLVGQVFNLPSSAGKLKTCPQTHKLPSSAGKLKTCPTTHEEIERARQRLGGPAETAKLFEAIRLAKPGGLGDAPKEDVRDAPTLGFRETMALAAERDLIARQYANGYRDVLDFGVPALLDGLKQFECVEAAIIHCQLAWLAEFPDSLIARKCGIERAEEVRIQAAAIRELGGLSTMEGRRAAFELDGDLRSDGHRLNPGTTADLVAACLFIALAQNTLNTSTPFRWTVPDWLPVPCPPSGTAFA